MRAALRQGKNNFFLLGAPGLREGWRLNWILIVQCHFREQSFSPQYLNSELIQIFDIVTNVLEINLGLLTIHAFLSCNINMYIHFYIKHMKDGNILIELRVNEGIKTADVSGMGKRLRSKRSQSYEN